MWKRCLFLGMERLVRPMTDFFITLSERQRGDAAVLRMIREPDSRAVYTGIDFTKLDAAADPVWTRQQLGVPEGWQLVVTAARFDPAKAPVLLIDAFAEVVKAEPRTLLLVAGDGALRPAVEARIRELDLGANIRLLGFRRDVPDLLRAADIFAFSSLSEAMGRAMIEAMLLGRPVVVPAIHGIPEIVRHGETGLLYPVGDARELAAHLIHLLRQPGERAKLGAAALRLTRRLFDVNDMVTALERIYGQCLRAAGHELPASPQIPQIAPGGAEEKLEAA